MKRSRNYNWRYLYAAILLIVAGLALSVWVFPQSLQTPAALVTVIVGVVVGVFGFLASLRQVVGVPAMLDSQPAKTPSYQPSTPVQGTEPDHTGRTEQGIHTDIAGHAQGPLFSGPIHGPVTIKYTAQATPEANQLLSSSAITKGRAEALVEREIGGSAGVQSPATSLDNKQVAVILEGDYQGFDQVRQQEFVGVLAALLHVEPATIRVLRVQAGSIVVVLELPAVAANRLREMIRSRDLRVVAAGILDYRTDDQPWQTIGRIPTPSQDPRVSALPSSQSPVASIFDQHGQTVHGPQTNIAGNVQGPVLSGDFKGPVHVGEINVGDISNASGVAIGHGAHIYVTPGGADALTAAIKLLLDKMNALPEGVDKQEATNAVALLEAEARKGDDADERRVRRWFALLAEAAPDVGDLAVMLFVNPIAGVGRAFQLVAARAKEERQMKGNA